MELVAVIVVALNIMLFMITEDLVKFWLDGKKVVIPVKFHAPEMVMELVELAVVVMQLLVVVDIQISVVLGM
eukprot:7618737-Pyramimonas_sp.AAC.1